jgi:hypothetical protein
MNQTVRLDHGFVLHDDCESTTSWNHDTAEDLTSTLP